MMGHPSVLNYNHQKLWASFVICRNTKNYILAYKVME